MRRVGECATCALVGAQAFWTPSILLSALRGYNFTADDVVSLTIAAPLAATASLLVLGMVSRSHIPWRLIALSQLFGIWALGPLCMMISASFSGGGFARPMTWHSVVVPVLFFPAFTPMMATYNGSLAALGFVIPTLPLAAWLAEARQAERHLRGRCSRWPSRYPSTKRCT
jgi:hypothetical protein